MSDLRDEPERLWEKVLAALKPNLSKPAFDSWLKNTKALAFADSLLLVGVPSEFARDWLQTRLYPLIQNSLRGVRPEEIEIEFQVVPPAQKEPAVSVTAAGRPSPFSARYTFGSFVVGNSNRFAYAAARAVADNPGRSYNPLFVYGGVGLGKTHLLHAVANEVLGKSPEQKILYMSSERFTNEVINGIRDHKMPEFRDRYRTVGVLLIDDIQFIAGKESTQEEFFHTFNALYEGSKQIVLSSDRPPKEIPSLEDRLRSRFEWGLMADIQAPDFETRVAILLKKMQKEEMEMPGEVLEYIAQNITANIRELEGGLNRLLAYASLSNLEIDLPMAQSVLKDIIPLTPTPLSVPDIQQEVANYFRLSIEDMVAKKRSHDISMPRHIAMYLVRELTDLSLPQIGDAFGGRDHTTVLYACDKIRNGLELDENLRAAVEIIKKHLFRLSH
jgi:chromosomal replication initiator protein